MVHYPNDLKPMQTSVQNPIFTSAGAPPIRFHIRSNPHSSTIRISIVCARKRRRQQQPFTNRKSTKLILNVALTVASNLNVLPPPVAALIREFGFGNGGGWRGGGGGGGGGGGFGWWGRRAARSLGFGLLVVVIGLGISAGLKCQNDAFWCGLGLGLVGSVILICGGNVRSGDWVLGFCVSAGMLGFLGMKRENVSKLMQKVRAFVPNFGSLKMIRGSKSRRVF